MRELPGVEYVYSNTTENRSMVSLRFFVGYPAQKAIVEAHAKYLQANRQARVALQGNADERGSREYNIALGQKRADAVKRMMTLMGVQDVVVETVSFGEEKPRNPASSEAAWSENRRCDLRYAGE